MLGEASEPALVLLGPPGCGKSTLLRRIELELDLAVDALRAGGAETRPLSFFVPLNRYRPLRPGETLPTPRDWLAQEWERRSPQLPALGDLLPSGRLVLLLDAVNEIPHTDEADYRECIGFWRDFLADLPAGTRALFSCRSLDYSASLSTGELPVPHVRTEPLGDDQVEEFLSVYDAQQGDELLRAGVSLQALEVQWEDVFYVHQLLQEYFAGRAVADKAQPELVAGAWRADEMVPSLPPTCWRGWPTPTRCRPRRPLAGRKPSCSPPRWRRPPMPSSAPCWR